MLMTYIFVVPLHYFILLGCLVPLSNLLHLCFIYVKQISGLLLALMYQTSLRHLIHQWNWQLIELAEGWLLQQSKRHAGNTNQSFTAECSTTTGRDLHSSTIMTPDTSVPATHIDGGTVSSKLWTPLDGSRCFWSCTFGWTFFGRLQPPAATVQWGSWRALENEFSSHSAFVGRLLSAQWAQGSVSADLRGLHYMKAIKTAPQGAPISYWNCGNNLCFYISILTPQWRNDLQ